MVDPSEPRDSNPSSENSSKSNKTSLYQKLRLPSPSRPRSQSSASETTTQSDMKKSTRRYTQPSSSVKPQSTYTMSPTSPKSPSPSPSSPRSFSLGNRASYPSSRKSSSDYRRYNGTLNHYGRHTNDWLFGGISVRETVREGLEKLRSQSK